MKDNDEDNMIKGVFMSPVTPHRNSPVCLLRPVVSLYLLSWYHGRSSNSAPAKYPLFSMTPRSLTNAIYRTTHCGNTSPCSP